ncbi:MAG: YidC/Oxa1 family insertase periplasmic-domain containing protein [Planctomycetes bacterium]|nr:YidC/Oxa1 family insertase periplasmic-domain containing protein [Planctomycetota bacterium]
MNWRRFTTVLLVMGGGMMLLAWYVQNQQGQNKPAAPTQPASALATQASRPAGDSGGPSSGPAASTPATAGGRDQPQTSPSQKWDRWITLQQPAHEKFLIGSLDSSTGYKFQVELDNLGAAIYTVKLSEHFISVKDRQFWAKDPKGYEEALAKEPGKYPGHYSLLNPGVAYECGKQFLPMATGTLTVSLAKDKSVFGQWNLQNVAWRRVPAAATAPSDSQSAVYEWSVYYNPQQVEPTGEMLLFTVRKTYTVRKNSFSVDVSLELINHWQRPIWVTIEQNGPTGVPHTVDAGSAVDERQTVYAKYNLPAKKISSSLLASDKLTKMSIDSPEELGRSDDPENQCLWLGQTNKFFASVLYVKPPGQNELSAPQYRIGWRLTAVDQTPTSRNGLMSILIGPGNAQTDGKQEYLHGLEVPPGGKGVRLDMDLFAGPKDRELLEGKEGVAGAKPLYGQLQYIDLLAISPCCNIEFCAVSWLALAMMWLLKALSGLTLGNFGLAIMVLVLVVRVIMHPLTRYSQVSMTKMSKKMAALQPEIQKLREKYADDKAELNRQMMLLYRQQGTGMSSGMLGCLPMLVQMPIWVALWSGIQASVELRHAAFLPVWITDLAAPDAILSWTFHIPLIGNSLNLLPLLLTVAMYLQQKLTPQMTAAAMTPEQASQQKMMKIMLPGMMLLIFYNMPSGLNLYIMASTFVGVIEQYFIRKHIKEKEQQDKSKETVVVAPGKMSRANRPKKPKGPFWFKR